MPLISVNFNPRSHERSDNIQNLTFALTKRFQSTLPREERRKKQSYNVRNRQFQSTLPREERQYFDEPNETPAEFQSTLPREERPIQSSLMVTKYDFNPRSHERSDDRYAQLTFNNDISIHAPTRGATLSLH